MSWLGEAHLARWGVDSMLLVKLLDAGQRLPVHAHPDDTFAAAQLASAHGKAEAWFILKPGVVHLGLRRDVDRAELARLVQDQDTTNLLGLLNQVTVAEHDAVVVPPGTLHAIGRGVLLAEVQQPTDLSILLEWDGFAIDGSLEGHLGLGFDRALDAVDTRATRPEQLEQLVRRSALEGPAFPALADPWFRLDRVTGSAAFDPGFAVIIATDGASVLTTTQGTLPRSSTACSFIPRNGRTPTPGGPGSILIPSVSWACCRQSRMSTPRPPTAPSSRFGTPGTGTAPGGGIAPGLPWLPPGLVNRALPSRLSSKIANAISSTGAASTPAVPAHTFRETAGCCMPWP